MIMQLSELSQVVRGTIRGTDISFASVSTDTRKLKSGDLFIALSGPRFDGAKFIHQAKKSGAVAALVPRVIAEDLPLVIVNDTRVALGELAAAWRQKTGPLVVAITGSNGKTTTKELVASVLGEQGPVLYTEGNLNNDIGVPLTLLRLTEEHQFAVVELGANNPGEIEYTSKITSPDLALITNAGSAHLEGFGTVEGVARAKGEIIDSVSENGTVILNSDDQFFGLWIERASSRRIISFGFSPKADVRVDSSTIEMLSPISGFQFVVEYLGDRCQFKLCLVGKHNISNALAAISVGLAAGMPLNRIAVGLSRVKPVVGRLQPIRGICGATVINDSYNANPSSLTVALDFLSSIPGKRWLICGAFAELGDRSKGFHEEIGQQAKAAGVLNLFAIGHETRGAVEAFGEGGFFYEHHTDLIDEVKKLIDEDVVILVKGSRNQRMEGVVDALTEHVSEN